MTADDQRKIAMVGPFPPLVHGMSTTDAGVNKNLAALGANVMALDTAAPSLGHLMSDSEPHI